MVDDIDLSAALFGIDFDVAKSIRYHAYRRYFFEQWDRLNKIVMIISGAAVVVAVVGKSGPLTAFFAIVVAVLSAVDLVVGFDQNARRHDSLYRRFCELQQEIAVIRDPTAAPVADLRRKRLAIEIDEPTILDLLERRCCREEAIARGTDIDGAWKLNRWQIIASQFWLFPSLGPAAPRE